MVEAAAAPAPGTSFIALMDALEGPGPLGARLDLLATRLAALLGPGAEVAVVVALADATIVAAGRAALEVAVDAARVPAGDGAALLIRPAAAATSEHALAAARLLAREVGWLRREARGARAEDVMSAVTHEMNNALTPLLCHACEPVVRESLRMRGLLEILRVVRGRSRPRELRWAGDVIERARKLLTLSGAGTFPIEVERDPAASRRAIGPEQERLMPVLLGAAFALRSHARAGTALTLRTRVDPVGLLRLEVEATIDAPCDLAGELERPDPASSGLDVRVRLDGGRVLVAVTLLRRPRIVLLEQPGGLGAGADVARVLEAVGIDVARTDGPDAALARAIEPVEPAAVLVLPGAAGQALRQGLHRTQPLLAARCFMLDERLVPRGHRPPPDDLDLGELLVAARDPAGPST